MLAELSSGSFRHGVALKMAGFNVLFLGFKTTIWGRFEFTDSTDSHLHWHTLTDSYCNRQSAVLALSSKDARSAGGHSWAIRAKEDVGRFRQVGKGYQGRSSVDQTSCRNFLLMNEHRHGVYVMNGRPRLALHLYVIEQCQNPWLLVVGDLRFTRFIARIAQQFWCLGISPSCCWWLMVVLEVFEVYGCFSK